MLTYFDIFRTGVGFALGEKSTVSWCRSKPSQIVLKIWPEPPRELALHLQKANSRSLCQTRAGE